MRPNFEHIGAQRVERCGVCLAPSPNSEVERRSGSERRKQIDPHELAQPPLERVPIHGRMLVARHHDSNTGKSERGSEHACVEMHGPNSLPLSNDGLKVTAPRQSVATRKTKAAVRLLRICSGV